METTSLGEPSGGRNSMLLLRLGVSKVLYLKAMERRTCIERLLEEGLGSILASTIVTRIRSSPCRRLWSRYGIERTDEKLEAYVRLT